MKIWKTLTTTGGNATLEMELNGLYQKGCEIKEIFPVTEDGYTRYVVIVYTEEDAVE